MRGKNTYIQLYPGVRGKMTYIQAQNALCATIEICAQGKNAYVFLACGAKMLMCDNSRQNSRSPNLISRLRSDCLKT